MSKCWDPRNCYRWTILQVCLDLEPNCPGPLSQINQWTVQETDYFKRKTAKADKNFVLGMNMKRQEVSFLMQKV